MARRDARCRWILAVFLPLLAVALPGVGFANPSSLQAQVPSSPSLTGEEQVVDRIVAVVGDSVVTETQLLERMLALQADGVEIPDDPEAMQQLRRDLVETLVNEQLVLQAAVEDITIVVDPQQVDDLVNEEIRRRTEAFGDQAALRQALQAQGLTMAGYRDMLESQIRRQQLQTQYMATRQQTADPIPVPEEELRSFFEENRQRMGERPPSITFEQVILRPQPSESAVAAAREEAEMLLDTLRSGDADFEELAERRSDDPGTREAGGSLGWFRRGQMVPAFEDVVFSLREGEVSGVVETRFGFHIIRVDRIRGSERRARHILVTPEITDENVSAARTQARDVRDRLEAGGMPIDSLRSAYGAETDELPDSLTLARTQLTSLPPGYLEALRNARPGEVLGPIEWGTGDQLNLAVVEVEAVRPGGEYTLEEALPQLRSILQQQKLLEQIFADLRERTHVEIRI